ncbi:MAG: molybdopterin-dependent oxidoreductase [Steroidobacteraceae bacterium]
MKRVMLRITLAAIPVMLRASARKSPLLRQFMSRHDAVAQMQLKDGSLGRYFIFKNGTVRSAAGVHPKPDVAMVFKDLATAGEFLKPPGKQDMAQIVHAVKNFKAVVNGRDELAVWFMQLLNMIGTAKSEFGTRMPDGTRRYTSTTNGGPIFVYVKDGKILRTTPIDLDSEDAAGWTIRARGQSFTPRRQATVSPFALSMKSLVYSEKRLLRPMKRVDFDPKGERNPQNRGKSGYVPISWDEALEIVCGEIKRMKREHGPGAIALYHSSHHQWGNVGYYLSALARFGNSIGFTRVHLNPDSWEGWYWGAVHHFGNSMRIGAVGAYGTVEDCLKECEMIVFWSGDPDAVPGAYGGSEGTQRRSWARDLGIKFVHITPNLTTTAQLFGGKWLPIRPGTDSALAQAVMYVWVTENLYDQEYVETRTTGFAQWRDYLIGATDGVAKTPEWQETETGVPAYEVRALARAWGKKKVYLAPGSGGTGFGGACRGAGGAQWSRNLIMMMAMQGWGKPGINFGNLQQGTPVDLGFYFPGYAEGGISGELQWSAAAVNNYLRMPHVLSMNPVKQLVPRQRLPEAIIEGKATGYLWDGSSMEAQFAPFEYPMPGFSKIHMLYRYGGSSFGTIVDSSRFAQMYRHPSLEFVVNQSIWNEGEAQFADIILPACTSLERWDIGEWSNCAGYVHHLQWQLNHRVILMQHKCIEPLGESKSDYQIFLDILTRLGLGAVFSEGCSELDWCKRVFDSTDLPAHISWDEFLKRGYYVVAPDSEVTRDATNFRWYAEGRRKDAPEALPLPSQYAEEFGKGVETASGKIEFIPESLKRNDADNPERGPLNRYIPSWEGLGTLDKVKDYPLQLISPHSRYSFHTYNDGKGATCDIEEHRMRIGGRYYLLARIHPDDAAARGIKQSDLVRLFNQRGSVICAADVSALVLPGVVMAYQASGMFEPQQDGDRVVDLGGCVNVLTPKRPLARNTEGMGANSCLINIESWKPSELAA